MIQVIDESGEEMAVNSDDFPWKMVSADRGITLAVV